MKIGLFIPCYDNAIYPKVGVASYRLLKSLGIDVDYPLAVSYTHLMTCIFNFKDGFFLLAVPEGI